jgi:hypothetical protein
MTEITDICEDPEKFVGCCLLTAPATGGEPTALLTMFTGCSLLHCYSNDDADGLDEPE